jgi:glycosyltransferase involved in cell wall biosynthesis
MKVTFINSIYETFSPTSAGAAISIWLWEMCLAARRSGIEPLVVTIERNSPAYDWKRTVFIPFPIPWKNRILSFAIRAERRLTGWRHLRQRIYVRRVAAAIKTAAMDNGLLICHNEPEMAIYLRRLLPNARIVLLFHNSNVPMRRAFRGSLSRTIDIILAVSDAAARSVENEYKLPLKTIKTLYNGVDLDEFKPADHKSNELPIINFTGRIRYEKAPDLLLKAALSVSAVTTNFSIQLLGRSELPDGQVDSYELEIRNLRSDLEHRGIVVRQPGYVDRRQVAQEVRKAHIHVTPSRKQEEFGLATVEAMASGLATIASRTGGTPEVVGTAGLLFDSGAVTELAAHLHSLVSDEKLRTLYATKARNRAEEFSWDRTWARLVELSV